jgi:hypothetical protein
MALDYESLDNLKYKIKGFFKENFKIKLGSLYSRTVMNSEVLILSPYEIITDNHIIKVDDLKKIEEFFKGVLKMEGSNADTRIKKIKESNKVSGLITMGFYYYMGFEVNLNFTYFKNNNEILLAISYIEIYKAGGEMEEVIMAKIESDMEEIEDLMKEEDYDDEDEYDDEEEDYDEEEEYEDYEDDEDYEEEDYDDEEEYDDE